MRVHSVFVLMALLAVAAVVVVARPLPRMQRMPQDAPRRSDAYKDVVGKPLPKEIAARMGNVNPNTFTVSGISAGACMAVQFQYAWSSIVKGAGIIAAAPYQCSGGSFSGAELCLNAPSIYENADSLYEGASTNADFGLIDPLINLRNHTVFLFSGSIDTVVPQPNMNNVGLMYELAGVQSITKYFNVTAEHAWITDKYGNSCATLGSPYINNCNLDFAHNFLRATFNTMGVAFNNTMAPLIAKNMFSFDQTQFGASSLISLGNTGYVYIPTRCQNSTTECHLHMNWHGCTQDAGSLGPEYVLFTEINEWAESNNIIVVYPQATPNDLQDNPDACFDWWGYVSGSYATKEGDQIQVFRAMISHFGGF